MLLRPIFQHKTLLNNALRAVSTASCIRRESSSQTKNSNSKQRWSIFPYVAGSAAIACTFYFYQLRKARRNLPAFRHEHRRSDLPDYTLKEIDERRDQGLIWTTYGRGVYDLTEYAKRHPGGEEIITTAAGRPLEPFWVEYGFHLNPEVMEQLENMRVGNLVHSYHGHHHHHHRHVDHEKPDRCKPPKTLPKIDAEKYRLKLKIDDEIVKELKLEDLKLYPKHSIVSAIPCKSDRKKDVNAPGSTWTGARLCDILQDVDGRNLRDYDELEFECLDVNNTGNGSYNSRISLDKVLLPLDSEKSIPELEVLLAYERNGSELEPEHGYPVRVVMPQLSGSRNVKWLSKIVFKKTRIMHENTESN